MSNTSFEYASSASEPSLRGPAPLPDIWRAGLDAVSIGSSPEESGSLHVGEPGGLDPACPVHGLLHAASACPNWADDASYRYAPGASAPLPVDDATANVYYRRELELFAARQAAREIADLVGGSSSDCSSSSGGVTIREEAEFDLERKLRGAVEVDVLPRENFQASVGRTGIPKRASEPFLDGSWMRAGLNYPAHFSPAGRHRVKRGERLRRRGVLANEAQRMLRNAFAEMPGNPVAGGETSQRLLQEYLNTLFAGEVQVRGWHRVRMDNDEKELFDIALDVELLGTTHSLRVSLGIFVRLYNFMAFRQRSKDTPLMLATKARSYSKSLSMGPECLAQVIHGTIVLAMHVSRSESDALKWLSADAGERVVNWSKRLASGLLDWGNEWLSGAKLLGWGFGGALAVGTLAGLWSSTWGYAPIAWTWWLMSVNWYSVVAVSTPLMLALSAALWLRLSRNQPIFLRGE
jgi:hypothetical protein